jgi:hypothetical protein
MAKIVICSWGKFIGGTAWDAHPESELRRRMRRGVNLPQHEIRCLLKGIRAGEKVVVDNVREEAVLGIIQILRVMGAEIEVETENFSDPQLFKKWPKR